MEAIVEAAMVEALEAVAALVVEEGLMKFSPFDGEFPRGGWRKE